MTKARRACLLALLLVPLAAAAQGAETLFNLVSFAAQASREVPNDLLGATLAAETEGSDPAALAAEVNRTMQNALALAREYRQVKVRSGSYQTLPVYDKHRIARWRARQDLRLESTEFAAVTELIGRLQSSMVVSGMTLSVSTEARRHAENSLIGEALAAFDERARLVRDALKAKGYRIRDLQVSGGGGGGPVPMASMAARAAVSELRTAPAVEAGTTRIVITASGTIQLQ